MKPTVVPVRCLCEGEAFSTVFTYTAPPAGETRFAFSGSSYRREVWSCQRCGHLVSVHDMDMDALYTQRYVDSTYGDDGLRRAFERITALESSKSDNAGRVTRLLEFAAVHLPASGPADRPRTILDVGSGLCVFLHRMKAAGWDGTALDPDPRAVAHARERVGVRAVCGDFLTVQGLGRFDAVAFNKVLEHVKDPVTMLSKALRYVKPDGFVYVELPDGEMAKADGPGREEFFIDHWHIFSPESTRQLATRAGFAVRALERLREPSGKYTLRAFLTPASSEAGDGR